MSLLWGLSAEENRILYWQLLIFRYVIAYKSFPLLFQSLLVDFDNLLKLQPAWCHSKFGTSETNNRVIPGLLYIEHFSSMPG